MGLYDTFMRAVGMRRPLGPHDPAPFAVSSSARARLKTLDEDGLGVHISLSPSGLGHLVHVDEGESQGPPPPGYDVAFTISDADLVRVAGLTLDRKGDRWTVSTHLEVHTQRTPNPDGRLYLTDRRLASGRPLFYAEIERAPPLAARFLQLEGVQSVLFRENTVTVERVPETPWETLDRAVDIALREHFLSAGQALDGTVEVSHDDELSQQIQAVLEEKILPGIHQDGGDLQFLGITDGIVRVSLNGACRSCPASTLTLKNGIEATLKAAFPEDVVSVEQV